MITANLCSSMLHKKTKENVLKIFWYSLPVNSVAYDYNFSCTKLRWVLIICFFRTWIPLDSEPVSRNYTGPDMTPCPSVMLCSQVYNITEFIYEVVFRNVTGVHLEILWKCPKLITQCKLMVLQVMTESRECACWHKKILEVLSSWIIFLLLDEFHRLIKSFLKW